MAGWCGRQVARRLCDWPRSSTAVPKVDAINHRSRCSSRPSRRWSTADTADVRSPDHGARRQDR
jgi:hypothetical protein